MICLFIQLPAQIQYSISESLEIPDAVTYSFQDLNLIVGTFDETVRNLIFRDSSNLFTPFSEGIYTVAEFGNVKFSD